MAVNDLSIINEASTDDAIKKHLIKYSLLHLSSFIRGGFFHAQNQEASNITQLNFVIESHYMTRNGLIKRSV